MHRYSQTFSPRAAIRPFSDAGPQRVTRVILIRPTRAHWVDWCTAAAKQANVTEQVLSVLRAYPYQGFAVARCEGSLEKVADICKQVAQQTPILLLRLSPPTRSALVRCAKTHSTNLQRRAECPAEMLGAGLSVAPCQVIPSSPASRLINFNPSLAS